MMKRILLALVVLTWCALARADGQGAPGVPATLATEISPRASEHGISAGLLLAPLSEAAARGVPPELVSPKVLEGISKGIPPERIAAVARELTSRLAEAEAELHEWAGARWRRSWPRRGPRRARAARRSFRPRMRSASWRAEAYRRAMRCRSASPSPAVAHGHPVRWLG